MPESGTPALDKLPAQCVSREPKSGHLVLLTRGVVGMRLVNGTKSPEEYNRAAGLTYEQVEAMEYGALFGFEGELADPDYVRTVRQQMGRPIGPIQEQEPLPVARPIAARSERPPKLKASDVGNFLPEFADAIEKRQRPNWG